MSKHPKGLTVLFFTEMWERFSFYGMRVLLVLFLVAETADGGFGWDEGDALTLLGLYMMSGYMMGIVGGVLADKVLGQKKAVMIGGALLCAGHLLMAVPAVWSFYTALVLIILGVGLLKPNVSTMVGGLYKPGDSRRDEGFTIFYMGINLGAFLATLLVSYVGERIGWHYGFSLAGFGMLLGQVVFVHGRKHLTHVGNLVKKPAKALQKVKTPLTFQERDRLKVLVLVLLVVGVYVVAFEQAGGLLTLYANNYTDRSLLGFEIPAGMFQSLNSGFILMFGALVAAYWIRREKRGGAASSIFKIGIGAMIVGTGYLFMIGASLQRTGSADGKSALFWLVAAYLFHTIGELCLSPVSLSFVTKVTPKRMAGAVMGIYWAVYGVGNFVAALVGKMAGELGELTIFGGLFLITAVMGTLLTLFSNRLNRLTHGAEQGQVDEEDEPIMELPEAARV